MSNVYTRYMTGSKHKKVQIRRYKPTIKHYSWGEIKSVTRLKRFVNPRGVKRIDSIGTKTYSYETYLSNHVGRKSLIYLVSSSASIFIGCAELSIYDSYKPGGTVLQLEHKEYLSVCDFFVEATKSRSKFYLYIYNPLLEDSDEYKIQINRRDLRRIKRNFTRAWDYLKDYE